MLTRLSLLLAFVALIGAFYVFDLGRWLTLEQLQVQQASLAAYQAEHQVLVALAYCLLYILVTALSLPGATLMTLAGGALFGLVWGTVLANVAATIGATLAFLMSRYLFGQWVQERFADRLKAVNRGLQQDGAFYLFSLRLVPIFPFFVINIVMGLTVIRVTTFFFVSALGMIAGTAVYVNAGTQLVQLSSLSDIASPSLIAAFVLLAIFPFVARALTRKIAQRRSGS